MLFINVKYLVHARHTLIALPELLVSA